MKTDLFYDTETSGLNPAFDQILTFACIRTDLELNEIDRQTITIQLRKDIVPSPRAFLTHGLTHDELKAGITEYEAALQLHQIFNTTDTISLGYNSLGFDDEFLRFLFYRNLLDPYLHQYGNGCSRMDILPIAAVFSVFHPDGLKWPRANGKPSLKLDLLSRENNFVTSGRAHEAMSDVEALIALSQNFFQNKKIWTYCLDFFNKTRDQARIEKIETGFKVQARRFKLGLIVSTAFGPDVQYMAPVVHLGQSHPYKNQSLWLRLDTDDILGLESGAKLKDTFVTRKRPGDALIVLPALERFWKKLPQVSQDSARDNIEKIRQHSKLFFDFMAYHCSYAYPIIPDLDPDAALYQEGFFSAQEKKQSHLFHATPNHQKFKILNTIKSPRVKTLAHRILARNFDHHPAERTGALDHLNRLTSDLETDQIIGYRNDKKFNQSQGLQELNEVKQTVLNPTLEQQAMIRWLEAYLKEL